jgi:hypothetical protein
LWNAIVLPVIDSLDHGIVHYIFCEVKIGRSEYFREHRNQFAVFVPEKMVDQLVYLLNFLQVTRLNINKNDIVGELKIRIPMATAALIFLSSGKDCRLETTPALSDQSSYHQLLGIRTPV